MNNSRFKSANVVITGGSSGIGFAVAKEFAAHGSNIFLIARDKEKLSRAGTELKQSYDTIKVQTYSGDLSNVEIAKNIIEEIGNQNIKIDILINNAGVMGCGRFEDLPIQEMENIFRINYWSAVYVTRFALPYLKKSNIAQIGFVSSVAGYTGLFGYCHYAPSKFAIAGLAECLRMEMKDYNIAITTIYPPDTQTPFLEFEHAHTLPECRALSKNAKVLSANEVAHDFVNGLLKKRFEVLCNGESRLIRILKGLYPAIYYNIVDGIVKKAKLKK